MTKDLATSKKVSVSEQLAIDEILKKFALLEKMTFHQKVNLKNEIIVLFRECKLRLNYEKMRGYTRELFFLEKNIEACQTLVKQLNLSF